MKIWGFSRRFSRSSFFHFRSNFHNLLLYTSKGRRKIFSRFPLIVLSKSAREKRQNRKNQIFKVTTHQNRFFRKILKKIEKIENRKFWKIFEKIWKNRKNRKFWKIFEIFEKKIFFEIFENFSKFSIFESWNFWKFRDFSKKNFKIFSKKSRF